MNMILTYPPFIDDLQKRLAQAPLPGYAAHQKMAHAVRRVDVNPDPASAKNAGVLITLFEKNPDDWQIVFIRKTTTHDQDKHSGQIGFPGGKAEPGDRDILFTALREAEEEVAMDLAAIDVIGSLTPLYITVSQFLVHPFVSYSWKIPELYRQESEIAEILEFPLKAFLEPASKTETRIRLGSGIVLNQVPAFHIQGQIIWGATAMIMSELLDVMGRDA